ncbi:MAG TPA: hypothetical protein VGB70_12810 [Allosphingosinicella sp.]|jgi:hypothetical protein
MNLTAQDLLRAMAPAENIAPVVPDNDVDLPDGPCNGLLVTAAGNLSLVAAGGGASGTFAVAAGQLVPVRVARVLAATTAALLALY